MQLDLFYIPPKDEEASEGKTCIACHTQKPYSAFAKHTGHKDNHDGRCRVCINKQRRLRDELRKEAPPKTTTCECCGRQSNDIVMDHCHKTEAFRGWICRYCNAGIGQLDDTIEGLEKALVYLRNHYERS